jgi:hypothetical protein
MSKHTTEPAASRRRLVRGMLVSLAKCYFNVYNCLVSSIPSELEYRIFKLCTHVYSFLMDQQGTGMTQAEYHSFSHRV